MIPKSYRFNQSTLKVPPSIRGSNPGGTTQAIGTPSRLDSEASLANPWNLPLSLTENMSITFVEC